MLFFPRIGNPYWIPIGSTGFYKPHNDWLNFRNLSGDKLKIKIILRLTKRIDLALISISTILKFSALKSELLRTSGSGIDRHLWYPVVIIPCRYKFSLGIKHVSSNFRMPIFDIELKGKRNPHKSFDLQRIIVISIRILFALYIHLYIYMLAVQPSDWTQWADIFLGT